MKLFKDLLDRVFRKSTVNPVAPVPSDDLTVIEAENKIAKKKHPSKLQSGKSNRTAYDGLEEVAQFMKGVKSCDTGVPKEADINLYMQALRRRLNKLMDSDSYTLTSSVNGSRRFVTFKKKKK